MIGTNLVKIIECKGKRNDSGENRVRFNTKRNYNYLINSSFLIYDFYHRKQRAPFISALSLRDLFVPCTLSMPLENHPDCHSLRRLHQRFLHLSGHLSQVCRGA